MAHMLDAVPPGEPLTATGELSGARRALHWYDFLCPFCYVGQQRNSILQRSGFEVVALAFQAHPDIPPGGRAAGERSGSMVRLIEEEARAAGLPLVWPARLPNTRMALAAAEWARQSASRSFPAFQEALFAAHFALGEDLGDRSILDRHAVEAGIDTAAMHGALDDGSAYANLDRSEAFAKELGVRGTPAWLIAGRLVLGLHPREQFEQLVQDADAGIGRDAARNLP